MTKAKPFKTRTGEPHPLGATPDKKGVNFSVYSRHAAGIELLIFDRSDNLEPIQVIDLDPVKNRTYHFWHTYVEGLRPGYFYAYRVDGPNDPSQGHRFNKNKVLIDPYSRGIDYSLWRREDAQGDDDNLKTSLRSAIINIDNCDWEGDKPLNLPLEETIVYEMHVGNFTKSPTSKCRYPGTFQGVIEKISYLKSLGITAVELMPVMDFDTGDKRNVWGYGTLGFFAPESTYCISPNKASHVRDFRDMVKALHRAGIEVILDVVFGYTTEGDHQGPTLCFKGFDNSVYYMLSQEDRQYYMNYSGCGNTLNCNHPVTAKFVIDCLEYWVREMHVDGFRFDEGSLLSRDDSGNVVHFPHVIWNIDLSPALSSTKIFAEPWDAGGAYLVGRFPGRRFVEWNGRFRDDMRRFVRGDGGLVSTIAGRITGSSDLYEHTGRLPLNSLNFITAHDGFTLYDLVSYNEKHNEANGEDNRDGSDNNLSWNCGTEGETNSSHIKHLRLKQLRNFLVLLFLSKGIPMVTMGDEIARTQKGNNNAYCHDDELTWFNWDLVRKNSGILDFFKLLIAFRKKHYFFYNNNIFVKLNKNGPEIKFHGPKLNAPGWDDPDCRVLAFTLQNSLHVMINMSNGDEIFELPELHGKQWFLSIDTGDEGVGICKIGQEKPVPKSEKFYVEEKSVVVLIAR